MLLARKGNKKFKTLAWMAGSALVAPAMASAADPVFSIISTPVGQSGPTVSRTGTFEVWMTSTTAVSDIGALQFEVEASPGVTLTGGTGDATWAPARGSAMTFAPAGNSIAAFDTLSSAYVFPANTSRRVATLNYSLDPGIKGDFGLNFSVYDRENNFDGTTLFHNTIDEESGEQLPIAAAGNNGTLTVATPKLKISNIPTLNKADTLQTGTFDVILEGPATDVSSFNYQLALSGGEGVKLSVAGMQNGIIAGEDSVPSDLSYWSGVAPSPTVFIAGGTDVAFSETPSPSVASVQGAKGVTRISYEIQPNVVGIFDLDFLPVDDEHPFGVNFRDSSDNAQPLDIESAQIIINGPSIAAGILNVSVSPASTRVLVGQSASLTAVLSNTGTVDDNDSLISIAVSGAISGTSPATLLPGSGTTSIAGNTAPVVAGNNTFTVNGTATNETLGGEATGSDSVSVTGVIQRSFVSPGTINIGRHFAGASISTGVNISTSGTHETTTDATLESYAGAPINGLNLAGDAAAIDGSSAGNDISRTITGTLTGSTGQVGGKFSVGASDELAGTAGEAAYVSFTGSIVEKRTFTVTNVDLGSVLRNANVSVSASGTITSTGTHETTTDVTVSQTTGSLGHGLSITGGSGAAVFNGPNANPQTATRTITGTLDTSNFGVISHSLQQSTTGEGIEGEGQYEIEVGFTANVGLAVADSSNSRSAFSGTLTATVDSGASYAALESQVRTDLTNGAAGGPVVGTTATIRAGKNTSDGSQTVSMAWRTRNRGAEAEIYPGGVPPFGFLPSGLGSDVVQVSGLEIDGGQSDGRRREASPFTLELTFQGSPDGEFEESSAIQGDIFLAWLDPGADGTVGSFEGDPLGADDRWVNAVTGNFHNAATADMQGYMGDADGAGPLVAGSWDSFVQQYNVTDANFADFVGAWGISLEDHKVWAVLDHNSQFAVVPEPSSLAYLGMGVMGLLSGRRRRRGIEASPKKKSTSQKHMR